MGQTLSQEYFGRVTSDGKYNTVFTINGRRHKVMSLRAKNMTNATVNIRVQQSDVDSEAEWESLYGQTLAPCAQGVDFLAPVTWSKDLLRVQASSAVDGLISITEVSSKEAFCSADSPSVDVGGVGSWFGVDRTTWCAIYCQSGSQAMSCTTSCEAVCQSFYQHE